MPPGLVPFVRELPTTKITGRGVLVQGVVYFQDRGLTAFLPPLKRVGFLPIFFEPRDHFRGAAEMVELGSGAHREVDDVRLTRRDCSCVAANADPRKLAAILARAGSAGGEGGQQINEHD